MPMWSLTPVANNNGEHVVVRAGTQQAAVNVASFNTPSGDTLTKAGNAALVLNGGQVQIAAGTAPDAGRTLVAEITQSDTDDTTPQAIVRPDRTYTISVRLYSGAGGGSEECGRHRAFGGCGAGNCGGIGGIAQHRQHRRQRRDKRHLMTIPLRISTPAMIWGLTPEGVVYIPGDVTPLQGDGLELTVAITVNDKAASKDNDATNPAVASITVKYVMDPGLGGQVQAVSDSSEVTSPTTIYRLAGR